MSLVLALLVRVANPIAIALETTRESVSSGTPSRGSLRHGRRLPSTGPNFETTSHLAAALGRNSVHRRVRDAMLAAYAELAQRDPQRRWQYAETGWPNGGRFRPHHTHQNGLSVDFVVPVSRADRSPATLFSWVGNQWTYALEFDARGCREDACIDFDAMAAHLLALSRHARANGLRVERVIFEPEYHRALFATARGARLRADVSFVSWRAWVRHDEHYHVDFSLASP
ncbi:MAG: penicillin-insensitive murein endopeptidase [Myxococcales bacterium]|nr:penicillin-insensitive murein endopeptidase [Myxococcales bacterium]